METREVMAAIEYKPGILVPSVDEGVEPPHLDIQVIRIDQGRLLVRLESSVESLRPEQEVELEVATSKALFRIFCAVERIVKVQEGGFIVYLLLDDIETVQRRKQSRFEVNFRCEFLPVAEDRRGDDVYLESSDQARGVGWVTNLSLGGCQMETEYELPVGMLAYLEIQMPTGHLDMLGRIVQSTRSSTGSSSYGLKFVRMDNITSQRLNRLILSFERRERQEREAGGAGGARGRRVVGRSRRASTERWDTRDRRRRR